MPSPEDYADRREEYAAWLAANGIDPVHVRRDADITIHDSPEGRVLHCEVCDLTPDGQRQLDERFNKVATKPVTVPLAVEPPAWWQPYVKPTRDDLLDVVGRVAQLAERWKHTGDRKNGPRQELLQALGEHAGTEAP